MNIDEALRELSMHLMQCGALMPIDWVTTHGEGSQFMDAYKMAMDALRNQPSDWISTKEQLPDPFTQVLICRKNAKGAYIVEQGHREINGWWKVYGTRTKSVTHWVALPSPPKG